MSRAPIKLRYTSIDGVRKTQSFKTLAGARRFAQKWVGEYPTCGVTYAVSDDGIGKIEVVYGVMLYDLFARE